MRVVAATNRDLERDHYFAGRYALKIGKRIDGVGAETMQRLCGYSRPGNVRELENVIERAVILARGSTLE